MRTLPAELRPMLDPLGELFSRSDDTLRIVLPEPHAQLHAHNKGHWAKKRILIQALRWKAKHRCVQASAVAWPAATIEYQFYFGDARLRDEANAVQSQKPAIDGIVDAKVIPNDDYTHLHLIGIHCYVDKENPRTEIILRRATMKQIKPVVSES